MSEFVGREAEIDLLARRIAAGEPRPLLITGPRRIGRTSLLREFRRRRGPRADQGGVLFAHIACRTAALSPLHLATAVGGELAVRHWLQIRLLFGTQGGRPRASHPELAPCWWGQLRGRFGPLCRRHEFAAGIGHGDGVKQRPRVRMGGVFVDRMRSADLHQSAHVKHRNPVADISDNRQVVRNENQGQFPVGADVLQKVNDMCLDGHV